MSTESNRKPARRRSGSSHSAMGPPPPLDVNAPSGGGIGASVIDDFVAGHGLADILRELVQNEFDGGGSSLEIAFDDSSLTVTGNGKPIDSGGWKRLSVLIGTGEVIGDARGKRNIAPKENGIGSKNLGLRSLFRIGNQIFVRSNGTMAVLDLLGNAHEQPDPNSRGKRGVQIRVPFRSERLRRHRPFTIKKEHEAFKHLTDDLLATLTKLALTGSEKNIEKLAISSKRTGQSLHWRQITRRVNCRLPGVSCIRRIGRLKHTLAEGDSKRSQTFEELEFSRIIAVPEEHSNEEFSPPPYFRARGGLKIGVSLPVKGGKRDRIDWSRSGTFFYPLAAKYSKTGTVASVNAPFQLNMDRSNLDTDSPWNEWLSEEAARLAMDLLADDWLDRFGVDAFLALNPNDGNPDWFSQAIFESFKTEECWPTRDRKDKSPLYAKAELIVIPADAVLDRHLSANRYLDDRLSSNDEIKNLALKCGAKSFSLNSLIRLRCAPEDDSELQTGVPDGDAKYYFTDYDDCLRNVDIQVRMAKAITTLAKHLSNDNRDDLKTSPSMLAADGSLNAAKDLKFVEKSVWDACPAELSTRLHPQLLEYKTITKLCAPFDVNKWIIETAELAGEEPLDEGEEEQLDDKRWEAFYSYLLDNGAEINRQALSAVKRNRTVKDHRGERAAPSWLVDLPRKEFQALEPVLEGPDRKLRQSKEFFKNLQIRRKLNGEDLIRMAEHIADHYEGAEDFERVLARHIPLLNPRKTLESLRETAFLRTRSGSLDEPQNLHISTPVNEACLNRPERFVGGTNKRLYQRLGCLEQPSFDALIDVLRELQNEERGPENPGKFYPAFVDALRRERMPLSEFEYDSILWVDGEFHEPEATLVGSNRIPSYFRRYLPHFTGAAAVCDAFVALGASRSPQSHHWAALFEEFGNRYPTNSETLPDGECRILKDAYSHLGEDGLPEEVSERARCLLSKAGTLHTLRELRRGAYLKDDFPKLSKALRKGGANIAFAAADSDTSLFFETLGLKKLSDVSRISGYKIGEECPTPDWFSELEGDMSEKFALEEFPIYLDALVRKCRERDGNFEHVGQADLDARLSTIERIRAVTKIDQIHKVPGATVRLSAEAAVVDGEFVLLRPKTELEFYLMLATGLAELAGASILSDVREFANRILPLLQCCSVAEMRAHLEREGAELGKRMRKRNGGKPVSDEQSGNESGGFMDNFIAAAKDGSESGDTQPDIRGDSDEHSPSSEPSVKKPPLELPPLENVQLNVLANSGGRIVGGRSSSGRAKSSWKPPSQRDVDRDMQIGKRGEELVYLKELERVRSELGCEHPEEWVIWISRKNPGADHDIKSITDKNKQPLWIEVKSTVGTDGQFNWSKNEFERALREGENYELWRVYQADTDQPVAVRFKNPVSLLISSGGLQLGNVRASVGPLKMVKED